MSLVADGTNESLRRQGRFAPIIPRPVALVGSDASTDPAVLEGYARLMEESGLFRIMRLLPARGFTPMFKAPGGRLALFVDVETTGEDPSSDEVIELAVVPFTYAPSGRIIAVHEPVSQLREPSKPIPAQVTRARGIDATMVRGRVIDDAPILPLVAAASIVIAHNAVWDRPFLERLLPSFSDLPWGCSMTQVPWKGEEVSGRSLSAIAASQGFFFSAHRAVDDCLAGIEILSRPLQRLGTPALAELIRNAERETRRVWALNSPYEARELLRRRGYRWSNGNDGRLRAWVIDVDEADVEAELSFLRREVFGCETDPPVTHVTAYERFSNRG